MKVFLSIVYYVFTFGLGLIIAAALPNIYMYNESLKHMEVSLSEGNYSEAMRLIGGYYNSEHVYQHTFDDGSGLVIFESAVLTADSDGNANRILNKAYSCFLYNVKDYTVSDGTENQSKIVFSSVPDGVGKVETKDKEILDYDIDQDGNKDTVSTIYERGLIYFDCLYSDLSTLNKIEFINYDGKIYQFVDDLKFDFNADFFNDVNDFLVEYNKNPDSSNTNLTPLGDAFLLKNSNYQMGTYGSVRENAMRKAVFVVLIYFVCVYILADFIVGKHYIIRLVKLIIRKCKNDTDEVPQRTSHEGFGNDYFSQVTFKLNCPESLDGGVVISYQNEDDYLEFVLTKDKEYTQVKRVHAGTYVNAQMDRNDYVALDLPKVLNVQGFSMNVVVTLAEANQDNINKGKD